MQAKWYRKLEALGFEDAETINGKGECELKVHHAFHFKQRQQYSGNEKTIAEEHGEKKKYYQRASELLRENSFLSETEKKIWELHSCGVPIRRIVEKLDELGISKGKNEVNKIINELQGLMFEAGS